MQRDSVRYFRPLPLDFGDELNFAQDALDPKTRFEFALEYADFSFDMGRKGVSGRLFQRAARRFDDLENDFVKCVDVIVEQNHPPGRVDALFRRNQHSFFHFRRCSPWEGNRRETRRSGRSYFQGVGLHRHEPAIRLGRAIGSIENGIAA